METEIEIEPTKICNVCKAAKTFPEFVKGKSGRPAAVCRTCKSAWLRAYFATPRGAALARKRRSADSEAKARAARKEYRVKFPERRAAKEAVQNAVRAGRLPSLKTVKCIKCGQDARDYHHHLGYEEKNWTNVVPLCRRCHKLEHAKTHDER